MVPVIAFRSPARFGGVAVSGSAASRPRSASSVSTAVMIAVDDEPSAPACACRLCAALRSRSAFCVSVDATSRVWVTNFGSLVEVEADRPQQHRQLDETEQLGADALEELARR